MKKWLLACICLFAPVCLAQITATPILQPHQHFVDGSGNPCAGCKLWSYAAGTTNPQPTYTSAAGGTQNPNPIVLDASGAANIWINSSAYKFALLDTFGATLWTVDNVAGSISNPTFGTITATDSVITPQLDDIYIVGTSLYPTISSAIAAAGSNGTVLIPESYAGTDSIDNPNNLQIIDLRTYDLDFHVWTGISPARPTANYPLGNDLRVETYGPADLYIEQTPVSTSTTTSLVVGVNTSVLVGSTANFATSAHSGLQVGRGTANYEIVSTFTIVDATHITLTCAKTHSGTTAIEQLGTTFLDMPSISVALNNPPGSTYNVPIPVYDSTRNFILNIPSDVTTVWPYAGLGIGARIYGSIGATDDLIFQNGLSTSTTHFRSSAGLDLFTLQDTGLLANNLPANGFRITPSTDTNAAYFYGTNAADSNITWRFDTSGGFTDQVSITTPQFILNGSTPVTSTSSAQPVMVTCATGGTGTQLCDASGNWVGGVGFDAYTSTAGCAFGSNGNGLDCSQGVITFSPAMPDTAYTIACTATFTGTMMTTTSALPGLLISGTPVSTTSFTLYEGVTSGSSTGYALSTSYGATAVCHIHHS